MPTSWCAIYEKGGLPFLLTSAETGRHCRAAGAYFRQAVCLCNSGVGKSSLLAQCARPTLFRAGRRGQSGARRGRHTTRHVELYTLSGGAEIIDTPGFSSFDTDELRACAERRCRRPFWTSRPIWTAAAFSGCSHTKEKGCAALEAVRAGKLSASRHASYLRLYNELQGPAGVEQQMKKRKRRGSRRFFHARGARDNAARYIL